MAGQGGIPINSESTCRPLHHNNTTGDLSSRHDSELGKLVMKHSSLIQSLEWTEFIHTVRGRSCISPLVSSIKHPATRVLEELRQAGAPVLCTTQEWSKSRRDEAVH